MNANGIQKHFFLRDVLEVAKDLPGMFLMRKYPDGLVKRYMITEVEAYRGEEDLACHASKGRTKRTEIMYDEGGKLYIYLIYGMYWMLNIVCSKKENPQAVLIRGIEPVYGPGKLTRLLQINHSFNGESLIQSEKIWLEEKTQQFKLKFGQRIGIDYSGLEWKKKPWRFYIPGFGLKNDE